jgi:AcrR family transcriptional regulator
MAGRSRAELQDHNRARVLAAAREEFAERGYRETRIDTVAERAGLTRGAVYSNFPGKRALYFAVLAADAERAAESPLPAPARTPREALGALARAWLDRLPLATDDRQHGLDRLGTDLLPEILADERTRRPFAQLLALDAVLLGLALERLHPATTRAGRLVRLAEVALTTLHGATQLAAAAPGFGEPADLVAACERLADLDLADAWQPPHLEFVPRARPTDAPWAPPPAPDALRRQPAQLTGDQVVAVLGLHRLGAVEEAVRAAPSGLAVTAVVVTSTPDELAPLARLAIADLRTSLRRAFPPSAWPPVQIVIDDAGSLAAAAGVPAVSDLTETAVRVTGNRITARAEGFGACHAAASAGGSAMAG